MEIVGIVAKLISGCRSIVGPLVAIGHTDHDCNGMLVGESLVVVGKVLPVIGTAHPGVGPELYLGTGSDGEPYGNSVILVVGRTEVVTQAAGDRKSFDRHEIESRRSPDVRSLALQILAVVPSHRARTVGYDAGNGCIVSVLVLHEHVVTVRGNESLHVRRQVVCRIESGSGWVVDVRRVVLLLVDVSLGVRRVGSLDGVVCGELEPGLDLVLGVNLESKPLQVVLVAIVHTVIVQIRESRIE